MKRLIAPIFMLAATALAVAAWMLAVQPEARPTVSPPASATVVAPSTVGLPTRVLIPAMELDAALRPVGLKPDGAMETPPFGQVGWYAPGARPGAAGPAVIVAHVHQPGAPDAFADLKMLRPGDEVTVLREDGATTFVVDVVEQLPKDDLPVDRIWNDSEASLLRLITCAGTPDPVTRMYPDNTIVYAHAR